MVESLQDLQSTLHVNNKSFLGDKSTTYLVDDAVGVNAVVEPGLYPTLLADLVTIGLQTYVNKQLDAVLHDNQRDFAGRLVQDECEMILW